MTSIVRKRKDRYRRLKLAFEPGPVTANPLGPWENLTRADQALIRKAVRGRWDVSQASRDRILGPVLDAALKSKNDRMALSACMTVVTMSAVDQEERFRAWKEYAKQQQAIAAEQQKMNSS